MTLKDISARDFFYAAVAVVGRARWKNVFL
jgi:hypothetical protein